jgi:3-oxoacyl-(acyl-carrier-protein) synthase
MVLGEAASACALSQNPENAVALVEGIGYATEILQHPVSISPEAECFQKSMEMALSGIGKNQVDAIVMHAPGTIAGDLSEYRAIRKTFGERLPLLTSTKCKTGHTFGASGMLSIELAIMMMRRQRFIGVPFFNQRQDRALRKILVNAVGFGGNAVSVLLSLP